MGYTRESSGSVVIGPITTTDYNVYSAEMKNNKLIPFRAFKVTENEKTVYYVANNGASTGDFKALVVYFCGWNNWGYGSRRAVALNSCYYTYKINLDANGGEIKTKTIYKDFDVDYKVSSNIPTKYQYVFAGWGESSTSTEPKYKITDSIPNSDFPVGSPPDSDPAGIDPYAVVGKGEITLYALWRQDTFEMLLDGESGYFVQYGHPLPTITTKPTRKGYIFNGYYTGKNGGGTCYYDKDLNPMFEWYDVDGPLSLYAYWIPIKYTIRFDKTEGVGSMPDITNVEYDSTRVLPNSTFTRTGYTFKSWWFENVEIANGAAVKNLTSTDGAIIILKALWSPRSYTVTYNMSSADIRNTTTVENVVFDSVYTYMQNTSWKQGYRFLYWIDSSGNIYKAGTKIVWNSTSNLIVTPVYDISDGILVMEEAIIPAGQTTYTIMLYEPIQSIVLTNSNGNKLSAYSYTFKNNVLTITLNSARIDDVTITVNDKNLLWHKGLMFVCLGKSGTTYTWKRTDMYVPNSEGEFVLIK